MKRIKVSELVLNWDLYPRGDVDAQNVNSIVEAMQSGDIMPPIVVDRKTTIVVDGFHRVAAHKIVYGKDCDIEVLEKSYKNDSEMFLDAVRYNSGHGERLSQWDKKRCVGIADRLGIADGTLATALRVPVQNIGKLSAKPVVGELSLNTPRNRQAPEVRTQDEIVPRREPEPTITVGGKFDRILDTLEERITDEMTAHPELEDIADDIENWRHILWECGLLANRPFVVTEEIKMAARGKHTKP